MNKVKYTCTPVKCRKEMKKASIMNLFSLTDRRDKFPSFDKFNITFGARNPKVFKNLQTKVKTFSYYRQPMHT